MIRNSLKSVFGKMEGEEHRFFTLRAEQLSVPDFVELTNWMEERIQYCGTRPNSTLLLNTNHNRPTQPR